MKISKLCQTFNILKYWIHPCEHKTNVLYGFCGKCFFFVWQFENKTNNCEEVHTFILISLSFFPPNDSFPFSAFFSTLLPLLASFIVIFIHIKAEAKWRFSLQHAFSIMPFLLKKMIFLIDTSRRKTKSKVRTLESIILY